MIMMGVLDNFPKKHVGFQSGRLECLCIRLLKKKAPLSPFPPPAPPPPLPQ
jgi:hypothetical protein